MVLTFANGKGRPNEHPRELGRGSPLDYLLFGLNLREMTPAKLSEQKTGHPTAITASLPSRRALLCSGRNLVRPSDSLFFAPQSDSEKKKNAIRKSSARNDQIRGLFGSPP
jgi:hypothetical protein